MNTMLLLLISSLSGKTRNIVDKDDALSLFPVYHALLEDLRALESQTDRKKMQFAPAC